MNRHIYTIELHHFVLFFFVVGFIFVFVFCFDKLKQKQKKIIIMKISVEIFDVVKLKNSKDAIVNGYGQTI